ncbi:hypothetical protein AOQ84DRAFT_129856 [Glonium stellatum]|uniref:Uncharacterized protein n=1 Tax=Glonium stellatum TaxID=574774 RepID=A0A8E2FDS0_9PEZI|nr:hypothetical protein AOQ84DRAFT_129856 [Glonium stellatum]
MTGFVMNGRLLIRINVDIPGSFTLWFTRIGSVIILPCLFLFFGCVRSTIVWHYDGVREELSLHVKMEFLPLHNSLLRIARRDSLILSLVGGPAISNCLGRISRALWLFVHYNAGYKNRLATQSCLDLSRFRSKLYTKITARKDVYIRIDAEEAMRIYPDW